MYENKSFTCRDHQDADGHMQRAELAHGSSDTVSREEKVRFIRQRVASSPRRGGEGNVAVSWIREKSYFASEAVLYNCVIFWCYVKTASFRSTSVI